MSVIVNKWICLEVLCWLCDSYFYFYDMMFVNINLLKMESGGVRVCGIFDNLYLFYIKGVIYFKCMVKRDIFVLFVND